METYEQMMARLGEPIVHDGVGPGWVPIVGGLIATLRAHGWTGQIFQIKEKFGGLRFYSWGEGQGMDDPDLYQQLVDNAEREAARTCEDCGAVGELQCLLGWYRTLCGACVTRLMQRDAG